MHVNLLAALMAVVISPQGPREVMAKAVDDFRAGRVEQSAAGFDPAKSHEHIAIAAQDRFAGVGGYMHDVARVHIHRR